MPSNPNAKKVIEAAKDTVEVNASFNAQVDQAFDEGIGAYQASQEKTLARIDELYEAAEKKIKEISETKLREADEAAYKTIVAAYAQSGLKGEEEDAGNE